MICLLGTHIAAIRLKHSESSGQEDNYLSPFQQLIIFIVEHGKLSCACTGLFRSNCLALIVPPAIRANPGPLLIAKCRDRQHYTITG